MKVKPADFTVDQQNAFISGWENAGGYTDDISNSPAPWCCPWCYMGEKEIEVSGDTPAEWGISWWEHCKDEIEQSIIKEEA